MKLSDSIDALSKAAKIASGPQISTGIPLYDLAPKIDIGAALRNYQHADYQYEIIMEAIIDFESSLDQDHEVALKLTSFGQTITLNVTEIGYSNPVLLHFHGFINGSDTRVELIQHVSQINFLLLAVPKSVPDKPARRIGFLQPSDTEDSDEA